MSTREIELVRPRIGVERIVVAIDGGPGSRAALRWVADHLRGAPSQIGVVSVVDEGASDDAAQVDLRAAVLVLRTISDNVEAYGQLRHGDAVSELLAAAIDVDADILVIGTHASSEHHQSARATVPGRLTARAQCIVIVVPEHWAPGSGPVVVGNSIDSASDTAIGFAHLVAAREGRDLVVAHVWELPTVGEIEPTPGGGESIPERQQEALDHVVRDMAAWAPVVSVRGDLRRGAVAQGLTAAAADAALLVVGRRRRTAAARTLLGSTSRAVVAGPPCAVAVVPGPRPGLRLTPETLAEDI